MYFNTLRFGILFLTAISIVVTASRAQSRESVLAQRMIAWPTENFEGLNYLGRVLTQDGAIVKAFKEREQPLISQVSKETGLSPGFIESLFGSLSQTQPIKPVSIHFIMGGPGTNRGIHRLLQLLPTKLSRPTTWLPHQGHDVSIPFGTLANHLRRASHAERSVIVLSEFEKYGLGLSQFYAEWILSAHQDSSIQNASVLIYVDAKWLVGPGVDLSSRSLTLPNPIKTQQDRLRNLLESADSIHILPEAIMKPYALSIERLAKNCGTSNDLD